MKIYLLAISFLSCTETKEIRIEPVTITIKSAEVIHRQGIKDRIALHTQSSGMRDYYIQIPLTEEINFQIGSKRGFMAVATRYRLFTNELQADLSYVYVTEQDQQGKDWIVNFHGNNGLSYYLQSNLCDSSLYITGAAIPFLSPR